MFWWGWGQLCIPLDCSSLAKAILATQKWSSHNPPPILPPPVEQRTNTLGKGAVETSCTNKLVSHIALIQFASINPARGFCSYLIEPPFSLQANLQSLICALNISGINKGHGCGAGPQHPCTASQAECGATVKYSWPPFSKHAVAEAGLPL